MLMLKPITKSSKQRWPQRPPLLLTACLIGLLFFFLESSSCFFTHENSQTIIGASITRRTTHEGDEGHESSTMVFSAAPSTFLNTLVECMSDPSCHVLYHHVQKTGGSNLASRLYPLMSAASSSHNSNETYRSKDWCCNQKLMDRFINTRDDFCQTKKMSIYEVTASQFGSVVQACTDHYPTQRYLALISLREPIQRTLSMIHHQCNKNFAHKNATEQAICQTCRYNNSDVSSNWFWDQFTNQTNQIYVDMLQVLQDQKRDYDSVKFLLLDNTMIDTFFDLLGRHLLSISEHKDSNAPASPPITMKGGRGNFEKTHICNFGMTSSMMKDLRMAQLIYRGLTAGYLLS